MRQTSKNSAFFHTLVIMGGSIVGCGGEAQDGSKHSPGDGDGDASSSGGATSGGQEGDGDGDVPLGSGGTGQVGDGDGDIIILPASGGFTSVGGSYMGGAHGLGCEPEQWDCPRNRYDCSWQESEILGNCTCDETKPLSQDDCPTGTAFSCMEGLEYDADYNGKMVPFACQCLQVTENSTCHDVCGAISTYPSDCYEPTDDFAGYICGCEIPVLR